MPPYRRNILRLTEYKLPLRRLGIMMKEARKVARITQEELAERTGTKKSYFSRIEGGQSDIQISTYFKLIEIGLGKRLNITIG